MSEEKKVPKRILLSLLSSLSAGVVPRVGAPYIAIGRTKEISSLCTNLETARDGGSFTKFIIGKYGSGKSFLISLLRGYANERNFVTCDCDLSPERRLSSTQGGGLYTYRELLKNMSTKTQDTNAISQILSKWLSDIQLSAGVNGYKKGSKEFDDYVKEKIYKTLQDIESGLGSFDFSHIITLYYDAYKNDDEVLKGKCIKWIRGEYRTKLESKNELGVNGVIDDNNWYEYIKLLAKFVKAIGYSGLVVFIDECVNLYKISNRVSRENNYEKILSIYNDTMQGKAEYLGVIFAGTPQFLEDPRRGLFSYEALKSRLIDTTVPFGKDLVNPLNPLIRLTRLSDDELLALIMRITNLYTQAYGEVNITNEDMKKFLYCILDRAGNSLITPREISRSYLIALSEVQAGKQIGDLIEMISPMQQTKDPDELDLTDIEI